MRLIKRSRPLTPANFLRWRRVRRWGILSAIASVLLVMTWLDQRGHLLFEGDLFHRYDHQTFRVVRVVDGDTLDIATPDGGQQTMRIRLWGIDTPELARGDDEAEPFAQEATDLAVALVDGQWVTLQLEPHRVRGTFGRVLAYVQLPDGRVLNEVILLAGLARVDDRWSHRQMDRYDLLETSARKNRRGLWRR